MEKEERQRDDKKQDTGGQRAEGPDLCSQWVAKEWKLGLEKKFWVTIARPLKGKLTCSDSILIDSKASLKVLPKQGRKTKNFARV